MTGSPPLWARRSSPSVRAGEIAALDRKWGGGHTEVVSDVRGDRRDAAAQSDQAESGAASIERLPRELAEQKRRADDRDRVANEREQRIYDDRRVGSERVLTRSRQALKRAREALERARSQVDRLGAGIDREGAESGREQAEVDREVASSERKADEPE